MKLSDVDVGHYANLRGFAVLEEVEPHRLGVNGGVILVSCADGDQFPDIFEHLGSVLADCGSLRRVHTIALNGGPLLLHPDSPLAQHGESPVLVAHIREASQLKNITTVALCAHGPCGKAYGGSLSLPQVIHLLKAGKQHLEQTAPGLVIYPFIQIDIPEGDGHRQRTYFVSGTRWADWCRTTGFSS